MKRPAPPILYLIFNRPDLQVQSFAPIRAARPAQLFVAADGPRPDRVGEADRCADARRVVEMVDWPCEVHTLFRDENLGCRKAVSEAISWFFEHVEEGIILEDDCVADASFFPFCAELLERYRDDERIMVISGDNHQQGIRRSSASFYFSKYPHCWGWASWRRAWQFYDDAMDGWEDKVRSKVFKRLFRNRNEKAFWCNRFSRVASGGLDTWDVAWVYSCWKMKGLTILPCCNLIENIGWGQEATHTKDFNPNVISRKQSIHFPLVYSNNVKRNHRADCYTDKLVFSGKPESIVNRLRHLRWRITAQIISRLKEYSSR